jgi:hypothetical protein
LTQAPSSNSLHGSSPDGRSTFSHQQTTASQALQNLLTISKRAQGQFPTTKIETVLPALTESLGRERTRHTTFPMDMKGDPLQAFPARITHLEISWSKIEFLRDFRNVVRKWTIKERETHKRRLITLFPTRVPLEYKLTLDYAITPLLEYDPESITISCIYWPERNDFFYTSVDFIATMERVLDSTFSVEEKNRIRRNMETFRPMTVTKGMDGSVDFFHTIMQFGDPKPRKIEKDVKVFRWATFEKAVAKIVEKWVRDLP